jgi:Fic family protein
MSIRAPHRTQVATLMDQYLELLINQQDLNEKITESEIAESVFNSNAIENSQLTLDETEQIIFESYAGKGLNLREVLEAKNLAQVYKNSNLIDGNSLNVESLLKAHSILLSGISDEYAGRLRKKGENVRVGSHVAPTAEKVPTLLNDLIKDYKVSQDYFLEKIAKFHLDFELIHPFCDGNGRLGRLLTNLQLKSHNCPPIIVRFSERKKYFSSFIEYKKKGKSATLEKILLMALLESFHKRICHLKQEKQITLAAWVRKNKASPTATYNAAKRQSLPAFRQNEVWMISDNAK